METHLSGFDALRPWRRTAIVAGAVAAVELVLLVAAALALFGSPLARHGGDATAAPVAKPAVKPRPRPARPAPAVPRLSRHDTSVLVLNGNGVAGAAGAEAARVRTRGYRVAGAANASRNDYGRSVVMYRRGRAPEGRRLARDLGIRIVGPLDGIRPGETRGAQLVVVIGRTS